MQPNKQLKVQYIGIFEEIDSFAVLNALLKRGPKYSGMGRPPPIIGAMPERKRFFSVDPFPKATMQVLGLPFHTRGGFK